MKNPKDATRKLPELINEFGKLARYKIKHRNLLHSYTLTMKEREIKETIPFSHHIKKNKIPGNKLTFCLRRQKTHTLKTLRC